MKTCKVCGSCALTLTQEGIDQGDLCDRHYWQDRAEKAEASVSLLRTGDTCARQCEGTACRIEARSLQARIETLIAAFKIEREGLVAECAELAAQCAELRRQCAEAAQ